MSQKLYEITGSMLPVIQQYQEAITQEELDYLGKQLESLELSFQEKALAVGHYCRNLEADIEVRENEIKRLQSKNKTAENQYEHLKKYLKNHMEAINIKRIDSPTVGVAIRNNPSKVVIDDESKIPLAYKREIPARLEVDKIKIKDAWKDNIGVDGTHIVQETRLEIK